MKPRYATLGESIYNKIDNNEYLHELYETILYNYSMGLIGDLKRKKPIKKNMHFDLQTYYQNLLTIQTQKDIVLGHKR